jgi:hypothetical protein
MVGAIDCPPNRVARVVVEKVRGVSAHDVPPTAGTSFVLDRSPFYFGYKRSCLPHPRDVVLHILGLSRRHAYFELREDGWWICDKDSWDGTWIEGQRIHERRLVNGTRVTLGSLGALDHNEPDFKSGITFEFRGT